MITRFTFIGRVVAALLGAAVLLTGVVATAHAAAFHLDYDSLQIDTATMTGGDYQMEAGLGTIAGGETPDTMSDAVADDSGGSGTAGGGSTDGQGGGGGGRRQSSLASLPQENENDSSSPQGSGASPGGSPAMSSAHSVVSEREMEMHAAGSEQSIASAAFSSRLTGTDGSPGETEGSAEHGMSSEKGSDKKSSTTAQSAADAVALGSMTMTEAAVLARLAWIARIKSLYGAIPAFLS